MTQPTSGRHVLSDSEYQIVVDAVRRWRAFGSEMAAVFEQQGRDAEAARRGALGMVALADDVLRVLDEKDS